jgi:hypothetical protein
MCTGVEPWVLAAVSAATTAAGTAAQISAKKQQRSASERAALQDMQRKQKTSAEANQLFQAEMEHSDPGDANADVDKAAAEQLAQAQALSQRENTGFQTGSETNAAQASATPIVKEVAARQLSDELAKAEGQMKARAVLQGFKQRQIQRGTEFGRAGEQMKNLGNFNQGWSQVAQTQQELAKNAGMNEAMLGDSLVGMGRIGLSAYGAGLGGGGAAAASQGGSTLANSQNVWGDAANSSLASGVGNSGATYGSVPFRMGGYFR